MVVAGDRVELHALIDRLPDEQLSQVKQDREFLLSGYTDRLQWLLDTAPYDDEPTMPEAAEVAEAREEVGRGETISMEEVKRLLLS